MKQFNSSIVILVFDMVVMILVSGESVAVSQRSPNPAVIVANILKACYRETVTEIGLAGSVSDSFTASITSGDPIAAVLLHFNEGSKPSVVVSRWSRHKLQLFAIAVTSSLELERILMDVKSSQWWNHMAHFYIFGSSDKKTPCSEAFEFLWTAWMMDILGAKFVCNDDTGEPLIYAFNPYTQYAPNPWILERTHQGINNHSWALLVRKYYEQSNICKNMDFDPTRKLGGYGITLGMPRKRISPRSEEIDQIHRHSGNSIVSGDISRFLNVTLKFVPCGNDPFEFIDEDGTGRGRLGDSINNRSDIVFHVVPLTAVPELSKTYPCIIQKLFVMTQYTAHLTQWQKVVSAIDNPSRIAVCIVMLVNVIFFKYALQQSFMIAILSTIRMICNSCFTRLPNKLGLRIYLAALFCFVVTIQAIFQGQLSALLAKQVRLPNINNRRDLAHSDYLIYGLHDIEVFFSDAAFKGRFVGLDNFEINCTDYVLLNSTIACLDIRKFLIYDAIKLNLHMSRHPILEVPASFLVREDWPLGERLNRHLSHYVESGLLEYVFKMLYADEQRTLFFHENAHSDENFKILTPSDLNFAFGILGIGLGCATISFFVECCIGKTRSLSVNIRSYLRDRFCI